MKRNRLKYCLNITYPSLQIMDDIKPDDVFKDVKKDKNISLYINLPFCTGKCFYCHYYTISNPRKSIVDYYIKSLKNEILLYKEKLGLLYAKSVYFGGGTPSYLSTTQLNDLLTFVNDEIIIPKDTEISMELHPKNVDEKKLDILLDQNVNRLNIGIDDFDNFLMKEMNRRHTLNDFLDTYKLCRSKGFDNINIDLIKGLIYQRNSNWKKNMRYIEKLRPESFTTYYLRLKKGTNLYYRYLKNPKLFPSEREIVEMGRYTIKKGKELGYEQNMADWFINDKKLEHKYQKQIWSRPEENELIGLGAASYSYLNDYQYYNINDALDYISSIYNNKLAIWKGEKLSLFERMNRNMFLGIRGGINKLYFRKTFGLNVEVVYKEIIDKMERLGYIENTRQEIKLTDEGSIYADEIGKLFRSPEIKERMAKIDPAKVSTVYKGFNQ